MRRDRKPLVSVIMPVHNGAEFIGEAVDSVLNQSYPHCELIVVDDGSTDDTAQVLEPYSSRLQFLRQKHSGSSAARNRGLAVAAGEYIAFLDADDLFPPRTVEQRVARFASSPSADMLCSGWRIVDLVGRPVVDVKPWEEDTKLDLPTLLLRKPVNVGCITCRRECLDQVGGFDIELMHAQDIDLAVQVVLAGYRAAWLREIGVLYRRRSGSASHRGPIQAQMMDKLLNKVFHSSGLPDPVRRRESEVRYYTHVWYAWHLAQLEYWDEARGRLRQALDYAADPGPAVAFQWMHMFDRWSKKYWYRALKPDELYTAIREVIPSSDGTAPRTADLLDFWWRVWRHYIDGVAALGAEGLNGFQHLPSPELVKWVQTIIFALDAELAPETLDRFWKDARSRGLVSEADSQEIVTLHLYAFSTNFLARRWISATRFLLAALRAGGQPRALIHWGRFVRTGLTYALRRAIG